MASAGSTTPGEKHFEGVPGFEGGGKGHLLWPSVLSFPEKTLHETDSNTSGEETDTDLLFLNCVSLTGSEVGLGGVSKPGPS